MTIREASCPGCGAPLEFRNAATVFVVCRSCGSASVRGDRDLELLGKVADLAPLASPIALGFEGRYEGKSWRAVGRIQVDHGLGPWNEWCLAFADGRWGWLAEAQGETYLTFPLEGAKVPPLDRIRVGDRIHLKGAGPFVAAELGAGRVVAVEGELPVEVLPGEEGRYVDLRGAGAGFATLDYGDGSGDPRVYAGRSVGWHEVGVDPAKAERPGPLRAVAERLGCPNCGASISLRDPDGALRVTCDSCGSLLEAKEGALAVVGKGLAMAKKPRLPLGSKGTLRGLKVEVVAFLIRSVTAAGIRYPWEEYLLRVDGGGYRWLTCSDGHWTLVEPVNLAETGLDDAVATWRGQTYKHFQGGTAVVDHVQGEVYWKVAVGEKVGARDYIAPPRMLSFETTKTERVASVGTRVDRSEVAAAFRPPAPLPKPEGVGPIDPNPWGDGVRGWWFAWGALAAGVILLMAFFHARAADRVVLAGSFTADRAAISFVPAPGTEPPPGRVAFSEEFVLKEEGNLGIELQADVDNSWLYVDAALVDLDRGDVRGFSMEASWYHGVSGGERWSEGSRTDRAWIGPLPPGRYALRFEPLGPPQGPGTIGYGVVVKTRVASTGRPLLLVLFLGAVPGIATALWASFESRRWQKSDHPWFEGE